MSEIYERRENGSRVRSVTLTRDQNDDNDGHVTQRNNYGLENMERTEILKLIWEFIEKNQ